jgi:hypothetical protein
MTDILAQRAHNRNVETVKRMKARGQAARTILDMEPGLVDAVTEVFGQEARLNLSATPDTARADMREDIARYNATHGGGSGAAGRLPSLRDALL